MSRYVDLDGLTWDGKTITSKIQEVKTKYGYMQGITIGWLWGDNVPHIDLACHDKQIMDEAVDGIFENVDDVDMDSNYIYLKFDKEKYSVPNGITRKAELKDWFLGQMKGEQNE